MNENELKKYKAVQKIAKDAMEYLKSYIKEGVSEADIANAASRFMLSRGASSFWYHGVGALVFVGSRTLLSISGRDYKPSGKAVGKNDFVTVDLGPQIGQYWGDYARSFVVVDGKVASNIGKTPPKKIKEMFEGIEAEKKLHKKLIDIVKPNMTFGELFSIMNELILEHDCVTLDFKKNLGHSIEKNVDDRIYIEDGCRKKLSDVSLFTFEPHIKIEGGQFGFKREDIYYFSGGVLRRL